ncbi:MAG: hypothetical protein ACO3JL_18870, partial [Myxococcota bacterium]
MAAAEVAGAAGNGSVGENGEGDGCGNGPVGTDEGDWNGDGAAGGTDHDGGENGDDGAVAAGETIPNGARAAGG